MIFGGVLGSISQKNVRQCFDRKRKVLLVNVNLRENEFHKKS